MKKKLKQPKTPQSESKLRGVQSVPSIKTTPDAAEAGGIVDQSFDKPKTAK